MCNLAGYTGSKRAAPILIEMLKREQYFDGGVCTGIATLDHGKIYMTKVVGNVDELLRQTDALDFPGTVGIAHSRPGGSLVNQAHPFLDSNENLALCLNGTLRDVGTDEYYTHSQQIMQGFLDRGLNIRSFIPENGKHKKLSNGLTYHDTEPIALMTGDLCDQGENLFAALAKAIESLPGDIVTLAIHKSEPDAVAIGRITRPMEVAVGDGESYVATSAMAFPEDIQYRAMLSAPEAAVSVIRPGTFSITEYPVESCRIQRITADIYAKGYARLERLLLDAEHPLTIYDMPFFDQWKDLWDEPYVECGYRTEVGLLKPYAALMYQILYAFNREGRLHQTMWDHNGKPLIGFTLDK